MHLVAMNLPSLEKFVQQVKSEGIILINSSLISIGSGRGDVDELKIPAYDIASKVGSVKAANIVALSAFVERSKMVDMEVFQECVKNEFKGNEKLIKLNNKAMAEGIKSAQ